jgi:hypothetical protein
MCSLYGNGILKGREGGQEKMAYMKVKTIWLLAKCASF